MNTKFIEISLFGLLFLLHFYYYYLNDVNLSNKTYNSLIFDILLFENKIFHIYLNIVITQFQLTETANFSVDILSLYFTKYISSLFAPTPYRLIE